VAATGGNRRVTVSWAAAPGATSYAVKRSTSATGPFSTVAGSVTALTYTDTGLQRNRRYYYVVVAVNAAGASPDSAVVSAVTNN
jgi:cellulose 1,4-beta-cellobiosidase